MKRLICWFKGHDWDVKQVKFSVMGQRMISYAPTCTRCGMIFIGKCEDWPDEVKDSPLCIIPSNTTGDSAND